MIFVSVGSREYQFDRLIERIDELIESELLPDDFFLQIGTSSYHPKSAPYEKFLDKKKFEYYQSKADIIISHGGTGALVSALKKGKQVIAVPRLEKFGEHIDDHQLQVTSALAAAGYLIEVKDMDNLYDAITMLKANPITKKYDQIPMIPNIIDGFIEREIAK